MPQQIRIVVIGATYLDACFQVEGLPTTDNTLFALESKLMYGGKGFNQAVATRKLGADVTFISAVGDDDNSRLVRRKMNDEPLHFPDEDVLINEVKDYTLPLVAILANGQDIRMVATPNDAKPPAPISLMHSAAQRILEANAVLVTCDYSKHLLSELVTILDRTSEPRRPLVVLNPAPALSRGYVPSELLRKMDWVVPNRFEATQLLGRNIEDDLELASRLAAVTAGSVCITLGAEGCVYQSKGRTNPVKQEAVPVVATDTTASSDAFCAALTFWLASGHTAAEAVEAASAAGAMACETFGSSGSMPELRQVEALIGRRDLGRVDS